MKKQWFIMLAIIFLAALAIYQTSSTSKEELPRIGNKAPQFSLSSLDGRSYSLETLNGKPVVINFWASWCGPCKIEAPEFVRLYTQYHGQLEIYAINVTDNDQLDDARAFAEKYDFIFPVLLDEKGEVAEFYQIKPIPTTFFINQEGVIVDQVTGLVDPQTLENKFKQLLR